jgi:demethylmenaquinone methyltransferase/2-methoxy-6-polyprenyl-1,4-benzoquinol methylase
VWWRKRAVKKLGDLKTPFILDIATGTGDFAITAARRLQTARIVGVDISEKMMEVGKQKVARLELTNRIEFQQGDCEHLQFETNSVDAILTGYGVRNFENLHAGLSEMHRVLKPQGKAVILEFSTPQKFPIKQLYMFYFKRILPAIGRLFSKDNSAYTYLPESVAAFPSGEKFITEAQKAGFSNTKYSFLTFGITALYVLEK